MEDLIIYELMSGLHPPRLSGVQYRAPSPGSWRSSPTSRAWGQRPGADATLSSTRCRTTGRWTGRSSALLAYNTVSFFAPNTSYPPAPSTTGRATSWKMLIQAASGRGWRCIWTGVQPHPEGNERGPFFSFKGFDNNIYYMLTPDGSTTTSAARQHPQLQTPWSTR